MIVQAEKITKAYGGRRVLEVDYFIIEKPGVYSLLGPNGAGKTTFFNIITGLVKPDSGRVLVMGKLVENSTAKKILGYCTQEHGLLEILTGYDNAQFYGRLYGLSDAEIKRKLHELADKLGLTREDLKKRVGTYSGGMKRKLSLIVSLLHDPEVLVLDEPTTGLDPSARREVWDVINNYREQGKTVLIATHYMEEADVLSDRVYIINQGRIIAEGTPGELKEKYGPRAVLELVFEQELTSRAIEVISRFSDKFTVNERKVRVQVDQVEKTAPQLISELYKYGYSVIEFRVTKPTLEDVFLKLTGRRLVEQ